MRTQIKPDEAAGRTIEGYHEYNGTAVVVVSGRAFFHITVDTWPGSSDPYVSALGKFDFLGNLHNLVAWDIATAEEVAALTVEHDAENVRAREEGERREFERLQKKYGTGSDR